ncbi:MAG: sulfatase [Rikenellaceae bacterium]
MKTTNIILPILGGLSAVGCAQAEEAIPQRPNIIWLMAEDMGQDLECYGMPAVQTPNLNQMAAQGVQYNKAVCANPISSPNRSAMMTGLTQVITNSHNHRSNRDTPIDSQYKPFTYYLREAGYECILGHHDVRGKGRKTDCNFKHQATGEWDGVENFGLFDRLDTLPANSDKPFFAQIQLVTTHRGDWWNSVTAESADPVNPAEVVLPPFMPDHPKVREEWASYLDQVEYMDAEVGMIFAELEAKGLLDNTIVFFIGDNGRCDIKGKGYLYEPGLKIPMLARGKGIQPTVEEGLVSVLDITATILDLAGVEIPSYYEGVPLFDKVTGASTTSHEAVYSARDTWDEIAECIRAVTTSDYKYIRNYMPEQGWDMHQQYLDFHRPAIHVMRTLEAEGKLTAAQSAFMAPTKPAEELYDLRTDPDELHNLASDPAMSSVMDDMRRHMDDWQAKNRDMGLEDKDSRTPEAALTTREYLKEQRPDVWKYITDGNVIDNYKELRVEATKFNRKQK